MIKNRRLPRLSVLLWASSLSFWLMALSFVKLPTSQAPPADGTISCQALMERPLSFRSRIMLYSWRVTFTLASLLEKAGIPLYDPFDPRMSDATRRALILRFTIQLSYLAGRPAGLSSSTGRPDLGSLRIPDSQRNQVNENYLAAVDDTMAILRDYFGDPSRPRPYAQRLVKLERRKNGLPYLAHLVGTVLSYVTDDDKASEAGALSLLLHDILENGPINAWRQLEDILQMNRSGLERVDPEERERALGFFCQEFPSIASQLAPGSTTANSAGDRQRSLQQGLSRTRSKEELTTLRQTFLNLAEQKIRMRIQADLPKYAKAILSDLDDYTRLENQPFARHMERIRYHAPKRVLIGKIHDRFDNLISIGTLEESFAAAQVAETVRQFLDPLATFPVRRSIRSAFIRRLALQGERFHDWTPIYRQVYDAGENRSQVHQELIGVIDRFLIWSLTLNFPEDEKLLPGFQSRLYEWKLYLLHSA